MYKILFTISAIITFASTCIYSNPTFDWNKKIEYIGYIKTDDVKLINNIGTYSIDKIADDNVYFNLNKKQYDHIKSLGIEIYFDSRKSATATSALTMASSMQEMSNWDAYPTYDTYLAMMSSFQENYPQLCKIDTIGYSINNRLILAAKISNNVLIDEPKPAFLYTATMHGDEIAGSVITLRLIDYLLSEYGNNEKVSKLMDNIEIYINPFSNPDGTYYGGNNDISGAIRRNANAVDLNRNFPDPDAGLNPDGNVHQQENIAMMDYISSKDFVLSMNFHGGEEVLNYPWDTWSKLHADNDWYYLISREFADTVHNYSSGYLTRFDNGVTNGFQWYTITGGRQDYVNFYTNGREITFEITETKLFDSNSLPNLWEYNYRSLLNYIDQTTYGIHGNITDSIGNPIAAKIEVLNHDKDSSHIYSDSNGKFYRFLKTGTYSIKISASGFTSLTIEDIVINDFQRYNLNAILEATKDDTLIKNDQTQPFKIYPNPSNGTITIEPVINTDFSNIDIFTTDGKIIKSEHSIGTQYQISNLPSGVYIIKIHNSSVLFTSKVIVQ